jgi:hypothetical protein
MDCPAIGGGDSVVHRTDPRDPAHRPEQRWAGIGESLSWFVPGRNAFQLDVITVIFATWWTGP